MTNQPPGPPPGPPPRWGQPDQPHQAGGEQPGQPGQQPYPWMQQGQQPYQQQPGQPAPGWGAPVAAAGKKRIGCLPMIGIGVLVLIVLGVIGSVAGGGSNSDGTTTAADTSTDTNTNTATGDSNDDTASSAPSKPKPTVDPRMAHTYGDQDHPVRIHPGKAFNIRGFQYKAGWRLHRDYFGDTEVDGLRVVNHRDEKDSALVDIKIWRGSEVLVTVTCSSDPIAVATTVHLSCSSPDKLPSKYSKITIQDEF